MAVTVIATIKAKAGKEEATRKALMALIEPTRAEAGCINYDLHQLTDDSTVFVFHENWKTKEDLDQHLAKPHLVDFLGKVDELLAEPVDIKLLDRIG
ncbi:MAG: antibiotic biosynthesis monooxygenase [Acidobacteriota bacterium]|nr:MAG: antibiotic biosynthesis monooxygenase [Acidobacteriota bacterium]